MRGNTVHMPLVEGALNKSRETLFQYDKGQRLIFEGIELPATYTVHYSNCKCGNSKSWIGDDTGVDILDEFLISGEPVYVYLVVQDESNGIETEYEGIIPVKQRSTPTDEEPTPIQRSVIDELIVRFRNAVTEVEAIQQSIEQAISGKADKTDTILNTHLSRGRKAGTNVGLASFAFGSEVEASGSYSHAEGLNSKASGFNGSHAEGHSTAAENDGAHAEGYGTRASGDYSHAEGDSTTAYGDRSHAEGSRTTANGNNSHAEGSETQATKPNAHAEGATTVASGTSSHAEGSGSIASGNCSHAEGSSTEATGVGAHAEGSSTDATNTNAHAEGAGTTASGSNSHAEGAGTTASGNSSHAEGAGTRATEIESHAEGGGSQATGRCAHAEGGGSVASGAQAHAEGGGTQATAAGAHAEGLGTRATGNGAHAEGSGTAATAAMAHAEGNGTTASGNLSHAEGTDTEASGYASHAEGSQTIASDTDTHAEGFGTEASGYVSHAEGSGAIASGVNAHAEGYGTHASGDQSHAEGYGSRAYGAISHAEGYNTSAENDCAHAEGSGSEATGWQSHAEGYYTTATRHAAHAEGYYTHATGERSHAEGSSNTASGTGSHAEGSNNEASGQSSHVEGEGNHAYGNNQHVFGKFSEQDSWSHLPEWVPGQLYHVGERVKKSYNDGCDGYECIMENSYTTFYDHMWRYLGHNTDHVEIVGNGSDQYNRSNARVLDWQGNEKLAGNLRIRCGGNMGDGEQVATLNDINQIQLAHICTAGEYDVATRVPTIVNPSPKIMYLVPSDDPETNDLFIEWLFESNAWERVGAAKMDTSGFYVKPVGGIPASDLAPGVIPEVPVTGATINNASIVQNGTAVIPLGTPVTYGVVKLALEDDAAEIIAEYEGEDDSMLIETTFVYEGEDDKVYFETEMDASDIADLIASGKFVILHLPTDEYAASYSYEMDTYVSITQYAAPYTDGLGTEHPANFIINTTGTGANNSFDPAQMIQETFITQTGKLALGLYID